ncbi:MAG TPA: PilZ domain-containing protein, partial [Polyangiaceae bacterium]|nr:PilZ domain-containing protein [Polyangiaceae bacterium]
MVDERRRDPRARNGGVVRCESATGKKLVSRWLDLGPGGLFVETDEPNPMGTLLTLEIEIPGERATASAAGRVTWIREAPSADGKPSGMGVTFIDVDHTVLASIGPFVAREASPERHAQSPHAVPSRERTVLGVGLSAHAPAAAASPRAPAPSREKTVLGVAPVTMSGPNGQPRPHDKAKRESLHNVDDLPEWPDEPPEPAKAAPPAAAPARQPQRHEQSLHVENRAKPEAEHSLPIDLVSGIKPGEPGAQHRLPKRKIVPIDSAVPSPAPAPSPAAQQVHKASAAGKQSIPAGQPGERRGLPPSSAPGEFREASLSPPGRRSTRRGVGAFVFLLLVLALAGGGYVYRARLWPWIARHGGFLRASAPVAPTPMGTPDGSSLPSLAAGESATAIAPAASPSATAKVDADAGAHAQPAALDASADVGVAKAPTHQ